VREQDVFEFLKRFSSPERFEIIFADPPYEKTKSGEHFTEKLLSNEILPQLLEPDGVFILEKLPAEEIPMTKFWEIRRSKRYGSTEVLFLRLATATTKTV
jgi:16S rRNA G966 N2-methylase RsmD